jgi:hypothetical protein
VKRSLAVCIVGMAILVATLAGPAAAGERPRGGCAPPFTSVAVSATGEWQDTAELVDTQGGNGDGTVCWADLAPKNQSKDMGVNIVDNKFPPHVS